MAKADITPLPDLLVLPNANVEAKLCRAIATYRGGGTSLESALGALVLGQHYGTRALRMIHSPSTYRKYEKILGIRFEDICPQYTPLSRRNIGIRFAQKLGAFWDVVMGRRKVDNKGHFTDAPENGHE